MTPSLFVLLALATPQIGAAHQPSGSEPNAADRKTELGIVPLAGGDTDYGFGVGFLANVAGVDPAVTPFIWRLEAGGFVSFRAKDISPAEWVNPYQDFYLVLTVPHFLHRRLRLELRPSYTRETTQRFYGLGNASIAPADDVPSRDFYGRAHPTLLTRLRWELVGDVYVQLGAAYTENWFAVDAESTLAAEMTAGTPTERQMLGTATEHGVLLVENALGYDSRDSEISPRRGQYHWVKLRSSPRLGEHLPYQYGQLDVAARFYVPFTERHGLASARSATGNSATSPSTSSRATRTRSRSGEAMASAVFPASATTAK